jgi:DNA primase
MQQRLTELTGVGQRAESTPHAQATPSMRARGGTPAPKRSLVRLAISLLLQKPSLAESIEPPYLFGALRQPGIPLLTEIVALALARPGITTGAVLEHFAEHEESAALHKLALASEPGTEAELTEVFQGAIRQLDDQTKIQRRDELNDKEHREGLSAAEQRERWALVMEIKASRP